MKQGSKGNGSSSVVIPSKMIPIKKSHDYKIQNVLNQETYSLNASLSQLGENDRSQNGSIEAIDQNIY